MARNEELSRRSLQTMSEPPKYVAPYAPPPDGRTPRVVDRRRVMGYRTNPNGGALVPIYIDE